MIRSMTDTACTPADLHRALEAGLRRGPGYRAGGMSLSSHLPMVLVALWRLGAPAAALERQLALWLPRLPVAEPPPPEHRPAAALLRERLPALLAAPEAAAFHGAIRLAYAWESGHAGELAAALQAWADSAGAVLGPPPAAAGGDAPLRAVIADVRADAALATGPRRRQTIMAEMREAQALPGFQAYLARPRLSLEALAEASLAVYLGSHDFTALHLVTGLHALRVLLATLPEAAQGQVLRCTWRAWLAAYVSIGRPAPDWAAVHEGSAGEEDWEAAKPALFASTNDHRIKLADAAREEWRQRGWPGYARCLRPLGAAQ